MYVCSVFTPGLDWLLSAVQSVLSTFFLSVEGYVFLLMDCNVVLLERIKAA